MLAARSQNPPGVPQRSFHCAYARRARSTRPSSTTTAFAHGFGFRQWPVPHFEHVVGVSDGSSAPHAEQKRTLGTRLGYAPRM